MIIKSLVIAFGLLQTGVAHAKTLREVYLGHTGLPTAFAQCIVEKAMKIPRLRERQLDRIGLIYVQQGGDVSVAHITFGLKDDGSSTPRLMGIALTSLDGDYGWQSVRDEEGEPTIYSKFVASKAAVLGTSSSIGQIDISSCVEQ